MTWRLEARITSEPNHVTAYKGLERPKADQNLSTPELVLIKWAMARDPEMQTWVAETINCQFGDTKMRKINGDKDKQNTTKYIKII